MHKYIGYSSALLFGLDPNFVNVLLKLFRPIQSIAELWDAGYAGPDGGPGRSERRPGKTGLARVAPSVRSN